MGHAPIPSRLGVYRLKEADKNIKKLFINIGKEYIFAVAEKYPQGPDDALVIIYFPISPYGSGEAVIFIRNENDTGFVRHSKVNMKGAPDYEIEVRRFAADEPVVHFESFDSVVSGYSGGRVTDSIKIGLMFQGTWWKAPQYSEWEEKSGNPIRYRILSGEVWDDTNSRQIMSMHRFSKSKKARARFSINLLPGKDSVPGQYLIPSDHILSVLSMTTLHTLLCWKYWVSDMNESSPRKRTSFSPEGKS